MARWLSMSAFICTATALGFVWAVVDVGSADAQAGGSPPATIHWLLWGGPPLHFPVGSGRSGHVDKALARVTRAIIGDRHELRDDLSLPRLVEVMRTDPDACTPSLVRTPEREAIALFSKPYVKALPVSLIVSSRGAAALAQRRLVEPSGMVRLDRLVRAGGLVGGLENGRSYGRAIDELLRNAPSSGIEPIAKDEFVYRMFAAKRFDWLLDYPDHAGFQAQSEGGGARPMSPLGWSRRRTWSRSRSLAPKDKLASGASPPSMRCSITRAVSSPRPATMKTGSTTTPSVGSRT